MPLNTASIQQIQQPLYRMPEQTATGFRLQNAQIDSQRASTEAMDARAREMEKEQAISDNERTAFEEHSQYMNDPVKFVSAINTDPRIGIKSKAEVYNQYRPRIQSGLIAQHRTAAMENGRLNEQKFIDMISADPQLGPDKAYEMLESTKGMKDILYKQEVEDSFGKKARIAQLVESARSSGQELSSGAQLAINNVAQQIGVEPPNMNDLDEVETYISLFGNKDKAIADFNAKKQLIETTYQNKSDLSEQQSEQRLAEIKARGQEQRRTKSTSPASKDVEDVSGEADLTLGLTTSTGKPLNGEANKSIQLNGQIITAADELTAMLDSGSLGVKKNIPFFKSAISTDAVLTTRNLVDLIGKKRSGAALSTQEEKLYNDLINDPRVLLNAESRESFRSLLTKLSAAAEAEGVSTTGNAEWYTKNWFPTYSDALAKRAKGQPAPTAAPSESWTDQKESRYQELLRKSAEGTLK